MDDQSPTPNDLARYIDSPEALKKLTVELRPATVVGVDTEFERSRTYYPKLALLQLAWDRGCALIDPLAIEDLAPLADFFTRESTHKAIHSASEDLEVLGLTFDHAPLGMFDTQRAAALCGLGASLSYKALVAEICAVEIDDDQTRSDWLKRPLSPAQLRYAADDVLYLPAIYDQLVNRLEELGRLDWALEDSAKAAEAQAQLQDPAERLFRIKSAWRLKPKQQRVLAALVEWRESAAQRRDLPRNFVLAEDTMIAIARARPGSADEFKAIQGVAERRAARLAKELLPVLQRVEDDPDFHPEPNINLPLNPEGRRKLKQLKALVADVASELQIDATVLASRRELTELVQTGQMPRALRGWREALMGDRLHELIGVTR